jgi:flagellar basal-body rod modification protein FlgD
MTTPTVGPTGSVTWGSTTATSGTSTGSTSKSGDRNAVDQDMFLKLLVAQLKYQDPSNPTDPSQFLSQTAQFTTVEKLNQLESLSRKAYDASRQQTAAAMIGTVATFTDASGQTQSGTVTGVSIGAATPNLTIGGLSVSLDQVTAVGTPPPTTATTGA